MSRMIACTVRIIARVSGATAWQARIGAQVAQATIAATSDPLRAIRAGLSAARTMAAHAPPSRDSAELPTAPAVPAPSPTPRPAVSTGIPLTGHAAGPCAPGGRVDLIDWSERGATLIIGADRIRITCEQAERLLDLLH